MRGGSDVSRGPRAESRTALARKSNWEPWSLVFRDLESDTIFISELSFMKKR
jgi:hypothetical protein